MLQRTATAPIMFLRPDVSDKYMYSVYAGSEGIERDLFVELFAYVTCRWGSLLPVTSMKFF